MMVVGNVTTFFKILFQLWIALNTICITMDESSG